MLRGIGSINEGEDGKRERMVIGRVKGVHGLIGIGVGT